MSRYATYCCHLCGECIGWLGQLMPFLHSCCPPTTEPPAVLRAPEPISDLVRNLVASIERGEWSRPEFEATCIAPDWWSICHVQASRTRLFFSADTRFGLWEPYELDFQDWMNESEKRATLAAIGEWANRNSSVWAAESLKSKHDQQRAAIEQALRTDAP